MLDVIIRLANPINNKYLKVAHCIDTKQNDETKNNCIKLINDDLRIDDNSIKLNVSNCLIL